MSDPLAALVGEALFWAIGSPIMLGLVILGSLFYFFIVNRVDRGGLVLVGLIVTGYMARAPVLGGFGLIDVWIYYVIVAVAGIATAIAFINQSR